MFVMELQKVKHLEYVARFHDVRDVRGETSKCPRERLTNTMRSRHSNILNCEPLISIRGFYIRPLNESLNL
jgi:hypothetical protein